LASNPLEQFVIRPIVPIQAAGYDISFTQSALCMVVGVILTSMLMTAGMGRKSLVPGRLQNVPEMLYEIMSGTVRDMLGDEGKKFFPFIFTLFMVVLMGNLLGLVPYSFTYTSHIIVTGALALFVFLFSTAVGVARHGLHFFSIFLPPGLPLILAVLIVPIEIISYLSRPISLSVRLAANMLAGHTMVKVIAGFSVMLITVAFGAVLGAIPVVINMAMLCLESIVALIQAYVFAVLACIYIKSTIELH
jgi:F-type H+-transporting ATPase subunit a